MTNSLVIDFWKDDKTVTYVHTEDDSQLFIIGGYPEGNNTIMVDGAESMNFVMNRLAESGYESDEAII